jgi:SagB-type dehydrogenase family enzyme
MPGAQEAYNEKHIQSEVGMNKDLKELREFLKDTLRKQFDFAQTDQNQGVPPPPLEKPAPPNGLRYTLPKPNTWQGISPVSIEQAIRNRKSHRLFVQKPLTLDELSFLLWATQGFRRRVNEATAFRMVPSAGSRHPFETYLGVRYVDSLLEGFYRFLPLEHELVFLFSEMEMAEKMTKASLGQEFVGKSAVTFYWVALPYRTEWRYSGASAKVIALDAGHICQNLYLACEAIGCGTCAIAAYDQELTDSLLRLDGVEEFVCYLAPVGKVPPS